MIDRRRLPVHLHAVLFQRAFEASARIITVADRMLETLINVGR